jgi:hypothetical protein
MQQGDNSQAGNIASFLIESLVWNAPNKLFKYPNLSDKVRSVLDYCVSKTKNKEECSDWYEVNGLKLLFKENQVWTQHQAHQFLNAARKYADLR